MMTTLSCKPIRTVRRADVTLGILSTVRLSLQILWGIAALSLVNSPLSRYYACNNLISANVVASFPLFVAKKEGKKRPEQELRKAREREGILIIIPVHRKYSKQQQHIFVSFLRSWLHFLFSLFSFLFLSFFPCPQTKDVDVDLYIKKKKDRQESQTTTVELSL